MERRKPPIIIGNQILSIFDIGIDELKLIISHLQNYEQIKGLTAAYLFAYAIFEGTLYKIYNKVLKAFPEKADLENTHLENNKLFSTSRTSVVIKDLCDEFSKSFGYSTFNQLIKKFNKIVGVDLKSIKFQNKELDNYKENRNSIAHKGTFSSDIPIILVKNHIEILINTLYLIKDKFELKYSKYTDIELIRKTCHYLFGMSDIEFNNCFDFSGGHVSIGLKPIERFYGRLSSSEAHCFLLFIANYNAGISNKFKVSDLRPRASLTDSTIDRISFINDLFEEYPHLINH